MWPGANPRLATYVALGQGLPLSELRFPGLQIKEWCWPLRAIARFSGKRPAQAGVEKEVSITGDRVYAGLGTVGNRSLFFSGPGSASRSCGPSGISYVTILMAHLQEAGSAVLLAPRKHSGNDQICTTPGLC